MNSIEKNLNDLNIQLPNLSTPVANYVPYKIVNDIVFISGQGPLKDNKVLFSGKVEVDLTIEEAQEAAKLCGINIIAAIKHAINDNWDKFECIIKLGGFVNSLPTFTEHPKVLNGASNLMVDVFNDNGKHSRFAVGSSSLPLNMAVEVDAIIKIK
ncbi:MAG: hypothetical protein CFH19_01113 [Alphaproteobacteria bacterium MarineAlpha5_Bin9]|nr:MAG: hypothetical protein CFH19_01113 [Alphaproteobacteria bacterium MarineAlpha5_Bin9]|tara:strand:- start:30125 stop:30589 length:465 start_codon:yes stop_codon:yes gene_type:complete